jgi:transcriptional regulator with XRE-family HTH domain
MGANRDHAQRVSFAEAFRHELARRGWTQKRAAEHMQIAQQEASAWANGRRLPSYERVPVVARFLRLTPEEVNTMIDEEVSLGARVDQLESKLVDLEATLRKIQRLLERGA